MANISTRPSGYVLEFDPCEFDLHIFEQLAEEGGNALEAGDPELASELLGRATELWRDSALADVQRGLFLQAHSVRLEEEHLRVLESRIEADLQLSRHRKLTSELRSLTTQNPLHEGFHAKLMLALHRSQRQNEALATYQRLQKSLDQELGLVPSLALRRLHYAILNADQSLEAGDPPRKQIEARSPVVVPAQLPPDTGDFSGRTAELGEVHRMLDRNAATSRTAIPVVLATGGLGTGKTAFIVHAAHRVRHDYPDGQLFANLRGSEPHPADPGEVLREMLLALGAQPEDIPGCPDERSRTFRSWIGERKVLVVLDDARSAEQVRPLLPGGPQSAVLISSRAPIHDLSEATSIGLEALSIEDAVSALASATGDEWITHDPAAAAGLVGLVGGLPLGIRAIGIRLRSARRYAPPILAARLAAHLHPLAELPVGRFDIRVPLENAYLQLDEQQRSVLCRLSQAERRVFEARDIVCSLEPGELDRIRNVLESLGEAGLVREAGPGPTGEMRYRCHELMRLYARERLASAAGGHEPVAIGRRRAS